MFLVSLLMMFDSTVLYNRSLDVVEWHLAHGYYIEAYYDVKESPFSVMDRAVMRFYDNLEEGRYRLSNGKYVDMTGVGEDDYRRQVSQYEFLQRDPATGYVNMEAPEQKFDRRIWPTQIVRLYNFGNPEFGVYHKDLVFVYLYEKPVNLETREKDKKLLYFLNGIKIDEEEYFRVIQSGTDTIRHGKNYLFDLN